MVRDMNAETIDDGGPAFPIPWGQVMSKSGKGMTLRDWLAGQETLSDYDHPDSWKHYSVMLEAVNGAPPDSKAEPLSYFKWECEARAKTPPAIPVSLRP